MSTPLGPAGWHPDPTGRFEYRYFNGNQWTADVSLHGQRFIDNGAPPTWQPGWGTSPPAGRQRTRGMAVASFVVGLVSLGLAWVPFVFVLAGAGAITAIVFGIIGVRAASRADGFGRGYAVAGIVLSVVAAVVCVVGFIFTRVVLREASAYLNPGPRTVLITRCEMAPGTGLTMEGTIRNNATKAHGYEITVQYVFEFGNSQTEVLAIPDVAVGATATFASKLTVLRAGGVRCLISSVYGPAPFRASTG